MATPPNATSLALTTAAVAAALLAAGAHAHAQSPREAQQLAPIVLEADELAQSLRFVMAPLALEGEAGSVVGVMPRDATASARGVACRVPCRLVLPAGRYELTSVRRGELRARARVALAPPGLRVRLRGPGNPAGGVALAVAGGATAVLGGVLTAVGYGMAAGCGFTAGCGLEYTAMGATSLGIGALAFGAGIAIAVSFARGGIDLRERLAPGTRAARAGAAPFLAAGGAGAGAWLEF